MTYATLRNAASLLAIGSCLTATAAHAEGVAAGSLIENTATATYSTGGGGTETIESNTVTVLVDELLDVTIASQDGGAIPIGSGTAILTYQLTNTGNGPEAYNLTADPDLPGNDFVVTVNSIAYDVDGNGEYDPAVDIILGDGEATPEVPADGSLTIFLLVQAPGGETDGQTSEVNLNADATTGTGAPGTVFAGQGEGGGDAVVGTTNADADTNGLLTAAIVTVELAKSVVIADPFGGAEAVPGATATFTIVASIVGSGSIDDLEVLDTIPDGTTYTASSLALDSASLTDAEDGDAGNADADGIAVQIGTANAGESYSITFDVTID